ncbi:MAG: nucleotidyltransferase domain-containing protein [Actinomycetota bacterium]|nr:nucleotidyltransferase domain-containing protein [Actinomycetota bacterium]
MIKFKKIEHDPRKYFPKLIEMLNKDKDIIAVYIFGSYASNNIGPLSDVDIAVLLDRQFPKDKYFDKQLDLIGEIAHILQTDEVDVVILNRAPVDFQYSIIRKSKLLLKRDEPQRVNFETKVTDKYLDTQRIRDEYYSFLHKRIKEGRMTSEHRLHKYQQSFRKAQRMFGEAKTSKRS